MVTVSVTFFLSLFPPFPPHSCRRCPSSHYKSSLALHLPALFSVSPLWLPLLTPSQILSSLPLNPFSLNAFSWQGVKRVIWCLYTHYNGASEMEPTPHQSIIHCFSMGLLILCVIVQTLWQRDMLIVFLSLSLCPAPSCSLWA